MAKTKSIPAHQLPNTIARRDGTAEVKRQDVAKPITSRRPAPIHRLLITGLYVRRFGDFR